MPALENLNSQSVSLLCVWASESREQLLAVMPLQARNTHYQLPMTNYALWRHTCCYLCSPLASEEITDQLLLEIRLQSDRFQ